MTFVELDTLDERLCRLFKSDCPLAPVGPFDERNNKIAKNLTLIRHAWIGPCNFLEEYCRGVRGCTSTNRAFYIQVAVPMRLPDAGRGQCDKRMLR